MGSLLGLLLATLGILALAWWVTRWIGLHGGAVTRWPGAGPFRVCAQLPLGRGERLALVRFQDRCLLLGVTEHTISLLLELDEGEAAAWLTEEKPAPGFQETLLALLKKRNGGGD